MMILLYFLAIIYSGFIIWCSAGWERIPGILNYQPASRSVFISVVIPARNEEAVITECLTDLVNQHYPADRFEIIVANDHSTDATEKKVKAFIQLHPGKNIQLISLQQGSSHVLYKKQAITEAVAVAKGELILTTDADCRMRKEWLSTMAGCYVDTNAALISAPVFFREEKNALEKMQSLEFLGLIAIGAAAIQNKHPFLCNGANMGFQKKIFFEVDGFHAQRNLATGDDTQLMLKIAKRSAEKIRFVKSLEAAVTTPAQQTVSALVNQRKRWASKIPVQMNAFTLFIALVAWLLHAGMIVAATRVLIDGEGAILLAGLFILKLLPEFILLFIICRFAGKKNLLYLFLPAQLLYPFYISFVGVASVFGSYQWKGRKLH